MQPRHSSGMTAFITRLQKGGLGAFSLMTWALCRLDSWRIGSVFEETGGNSLGMPDTPFDDQARTGVSGSF